MGTHVVLSFANNPISLSECSTRMQRARSRARWYVVNFFRDFDAVGVKRLGER